MRMQYEHNGKYWQFQFKNNVDEKTLISYIHKHYRQPYPPIPMSAMSHNSYTMKISGQQGFKPFSHCLIPGTVVADQWRTYTEAAE